MYQVLYINNYIGLLKMRDATLHNATQLNLQRAP